MGYVSHTVFAILYHGYASLPVDFSIIITLESHKHWRRSIALWSSGCQCWQEQMITRKQEPFYLEVTVITRQTFELKKKLFTFTKERNWILYLRTSTQLLLAVVGRNWYQIYHLPNHIEWHPASQAACSIWKNIFGKQYQWCELALVCVPPLDQFFEWPLFIDTSQPDLPGWPGFLKFSLQPCAVNTIII